MGAVAGHVAHGVAFCIFGLWHLINHIKLHILHPRSYINHPWFPVPRMRYLELYMIIGSCMISIATELFIGRQRHQPLGPDGTIPPYHLHNFEHSSISLSFFIYAIFSIILDKNSTLPTHSHYGIAQLLGANAFSQQLLLFHLHSSDHIGIEGQYHFLLQIVIFISLSTTLLSIPYPKSFLTSFVRSFSLLFQGVWLIVMGIMIWTPGLIPKGCFLGSNKQGQKIVKCHSHEELQRAKSLINIQFSFYLTIVATLTVLLYLALKKSYGEEIEYHSLTKLDHQELEEIDRDVQDQYQKKNKFGESISSFLEMGKFPSADVQRQG